MKLTTRLFALVGCLLLFVGVFAHAHQSIGSITWNLTDGVTVHTGAQVKVLATAYEPSGVRVLTVTGGFSGSGCAIPSVPYPKSATVGVTFFGSYPIPYGDYTYRATAIGADGSQVSAQMILHYVK